MNKMVLYRFISAALIVCIASHGILLAKPADVWGQKDDSCLLLCGLSETAALFLSLQNCPKTRGVFSVLDGCSPLGSHGFCFWNTYHRHTFKSGHHLNSLCEAAAPETLYALHCQFTI